MTSPHVSLLSRQGNGYGRYHAARANLLVHIVAVPMFLLGNIVIVAALAAGVWMGVLAGVVLTVASLAAPGRGHRGEPNPPEPFASPMNAVARILSEQWISFPRFLLSGQWLRALRAAGPCPKSRTLT